MRHEFYLQYEKKSLLAEKEQCTIAMKALISNWVRGVILLEN